MEGNAKINIDQAIANVRARDAARPMATFTNEDLSDAEIKRISEDEVPSATEAKKILTGEVDFGTARP
jgi:hypothetical protein